jgi:UDP-N-acetylmuramate-alanine ligase
LRTAEPRDVIVTMGAGDVTSLGRELLERAKVLV